MRIVTTYTKFNLIYILYIFIRNLFVNANMLILLKILLKNVFIRGVVTLYCKRLLFLFVELWVMIKKSLNQFFVDLRGCCEGIRIGRYKNIVCSRTNHGNFSWNILFIKPLNIISDCLFLLKI